MIVPKRAKVGYRRFIHEPRQLRLAGFFRALCLTKLPHARYQSIRPDAARVSARQFSDFRLSPQAAGPYRDRDPVVLGKLRLFCPEFVMLEVCSRRFRRDTLLDSDVGLGTQAVALSDSVSESWVRRVEQQRRESGQVEGNRTRDRTRRRHA